MTADEESHGAAVIDIIEQRMQENAALRAENQRLREALKPLARVAEKIDGHPLGQRRPDRATLWQANAYLRGPFDLTMGHARAARRALEATDANL